MKKYKEPQSPEEALKRLKTAISFICRGRINDYKPEAAKMLAYLEKGLISLQEFKRHIEEGSKPLEATPTVTND